MPDFTEPVPVNIQKASPRVNLTEISTLLAEIKQIIEAQSNALPQTPTMFEVYSLLGSTITAQGWNVATPSDLSAVVDNNPGTATTWGPMTRISSRGVIQVDLMQINRYYVEIKLGIKMAPEFPGGEADWFAGMSDTSDGIVPSWYTRFRPGSTERTILVSGLITGRYLKVGTMDTRAGAPEIRVYSLKVWKFNLPTTSGVSGEKKSFLSHHFIFSTFCYCLWISSG